MCRQVPCDDCKKPTWKGCGLHIDTALQGTPVDLRCKCKPWTQEIHDQKRPVAAYEKPFLMLAACARELAPYKYHIGALAGAAIAVTAILPRLKAQAS